MKKALIKKIFPAVFLAACATNIDFIPAETLKTQQMVELTNIEDYENLLKKNKVKTVYYTHDYFAAEINTVLYVLQSRGYTNFHDYREGKLSSPQEYSIFKPGYSFKRK